MPSIHRGDLDALVELIYRAAIDTALWPELLKNVADELGGTSAWLSELDSVSGLGQGITARIDPRMPVLYQQHYAGLNPFPAATPAGKAVQSRRSPAVLLASDLVEDAVLVKGDYYNEFMRPQDVHAVLIIRLAVIGRLSAAININRPKAWGPFGSQHLAKARLLADHLVRAFHLGKKIGATVTAPDAKAAIVLDAECQVRHVNDKAGHLIASQPGLLRVINATLCLREAGDDLRLRKAVHEAASGESLICKGSIVVCGGMVLSIAPVRSTLMPIFSVRPLALVVIDDLQTDEAQARTLFTRALRLTPAESRVAYAFLEGAAPREIALRLGVSHNTVRVHFANIFSKTSVSRQADLARLLDRVIVAGSYT